MSKNIETRASKANREAKAAEKSKGKDKADKPKVVTDLKDLDTLGVEAKEPEAKAEAPKDDVPKGKLGFLTRQYLMAGAEKLMGTPSPNLKSVEFRATLLHWRSVMIQSVAVNDGSVINGFVCAVQAIASSEGALQAKRMVDNVMGQVMFQGGVDIARADARDSLTAGDVEVIERERIGAYTEDLRHDGNTPPLGLDPDRDPDREVLPNAADVREAIEEANQWLGLIADQLPVDAAERTYLGLDGGLPYCQRKEESALQPGQFVWVNVYDLEEALQIQRDKAKASFALRTARTIEARKGTFSKIAKLAA